MASLPFWREAGSEQENRSHGRARKRGTNFDIRTAATEAVEFKKLTYLVALIRTL